MAHQPKHAAKAQATNADHKPKHAAKSAVSKSKISGKPSGMASMRAMRGDWSNG